jgi:hypothetical protein
MMSHEHSKYEVFQVVTVIASMPVAVALLFPLPGGPQDAPPPPPPPISPLLAGSRSSPYPGSQLAAGHNT